MPYTIHLGTPWALALAGFFVGRRPLGMGIADPFGTMTDSAGLSSGGGGSPHKKLNDAVQLGLGECRQSVAPIVTLAQFIEDLRATSGWTGDEVRQVETTLRHLLTRIVSKPR